MTVDLFKQLSQLTIAAFTDSEVEHYHAHKPEKKKKREFLNEKKKLTSTLKHTWGIEMPPISL